MENEEIYEAVVAGASGSFGADGAGGAKPAESVERASSSKAGEVRDGGVTRWISAFEARRLIETLRVELEGLSESELYALRVEPQRVADTAIGIVRRDSEPERRGVFERFAEQGNYDIGHLRRMHDFAQVVWHARREQSRVEHGASEAALPEEEVAAAYERRGRMIRVLDYQLGDRADIRELLDYLREGSGHLDLANDLHDLAETYQRDDVRAVLETDTKYYRASDADEAVRQAEMIRASQGPLEAGERERLSGLVRRAVTLLVRSYGEHQRVGQFLFGLREDVAVTYPSLVGAVRTPRRKRAAGGKGGEGSGGEPSDETPTDGA
jgi:hypothetical protein